MLRIILWTITLVVGVGVPVWVYLAFFADEPVFSPKDDIALGRQTVRAIEEDPTTYPLLPKEDYPEAYAQLRRLVTTISSSSEILYDDHFPYVDVLIINDDSTLNAFCTPGGYIYVYTGLIRYLEAEDHLAGVLGHEIAHAEGRHSSLRLQKEYGTKKLLELAFWTPGVSLSSVVMAKFLSDLTGLNYSRGQEAEADRLSVHYLSDSEYACNGAAGFFEKLLSEGKDAPIPEFLSDHPDSAARVSAIHGEAAALGCRTDIGDQTRWKSFQASLPKSAKEFE